MRVYFNGNLIKEKTFVFVGRDDAQVYAAYYYGSGFGNPAINIAVKDLEYGEY